MSDLQEVRNRLIVLETQSEERWKSHTVQSKIIWTVIDDKLDLLIRHKDDQQLHKDKCMQEAKSYTKSLVGWVLGVPTTIGTIIGIIWGLKRILLLSAVVCLFLCGCGITTEFYIADKKVGHIKQDSAGQAILKTENMEMSVDTRKPSAWERFITPMVSGAVGTAKEGAGAL